MLFFLKKGFANQEAENCRTVSVERENYTKKWWWITIDGKIENLCMDRITKFGVLLLQSALPLITSVIHITYSIIYLTTICGFSKSGMHDFNMIFEISLNERSNVASTASTFIAYQ